MPTSVLDNVVSSQLVEAALGQDARGFSLLYGDLLVLLVGIPDGDAELETELCTSEPGAGVMPYKTETLAMKGTPRRALGALADDPADLVRLLGKQRYFPLALSKRADSDALYPERISVGRARNKDIVLRHASVSKFHAWFETSRDGTAYVADADSKNLTRLNGETLLPRERTAVAPGDFVRFGSIDCLLCEPSAFWAALRMRAPTAAPPAGRPMRNP